MQSIPSSHPTAVPQAPPAQAPRRGQADAEFPPPLARHAGAAPPAPAWFRDAIAQAPERHWLKVQGAPVEWLAWGRRGDPGLLLLHGNSAHADWYSFIAPLLLPGRRIVAPSFSGMGGSGWRTHYGVAQWADEALAVAEAGGLFEAATAPVAAAHSFGGFVLMNLASRHGGRLARAVIVDTPLRPPPALDRARRHRSEGLRSARVYASEAEALARFRLLPPQDCTHVFLADWIARRGLKQVHGPSGAPGWVWRFDPFLFRHFTFGSPWRELRTAGCPVVLVRGGRSRLFTEPMMVHALQMAPEGTQAREVPDADHHVMLDQPQALAALLAGLAPC
jgi:pimeloyl-ACP methyl ester carboxylesterase